MADFAPPSGPPPPKVPQGYKAVWNEQYKEWFYVNIYTKQSQWDKPESPVYPPGGGDGDAPPSGAPPAYNPANAQQLGPEKTGGSTGAAMFGSGGGSSHGPDTSSDEAYARRLQEEETARTSGAKDRGESDSYYNSGAPATYGQNYGASGVSPGLGAQQSYAAQEDQGTQKKGFLGKLLGKKPSSQQSYGAPQGYPQQQGYYQGPPQQQYGYPPQQGYYPQGAYAQQQRPKKHGLGVGTGAALGLGGGLLGGMLLGEALEGGDGGGFGGDGGGFGGDGGGFGGDGGGDFGGGGGDFGGGGGDF